MVIALAAFAGLPLLYRTFSVLYGQIRLLVSLNTENQRYFATQTSEWVPWLKQHVLYSPLFRVRHNREIQLSSAVNIGTLPTRFQTFFLLGYVAANITFCTLMIDYSDGAVSMLGELKNRTGILATINMVPLFLMAWRNNPLIQLLGISFDTFNLIHRWLGRIVVLEALTHSISWMVSKSIKNGSETIMSTIISSSKFLLPGFIVCFIFQLSDETLI